MMLFHSLAASLWLTILFGFGTAASGQSTASDSPAARAFVESFYRWYVPIATSDLKGPAYVIALEQRPILFSTTLLTALRADADAQAKVTGEIVGLDFDPFLYSQDPCANFSTGTVTRRGSSYLVSVHAVSSGKRRARRGVLAEVRRAKGS